MDFVADLIGSEHAASLSDVLEMFHDLTGFVLGLLEHANAELDEGEPGANFQLLDLAYPRARAELPVTLRQRVERTLRAGKSSLDYFF